MVKSLLFILLVIWCAACKRQGKEAELLDKLTEAKSDSEKVKLYAELHNLFEATNPEKLEKYTKQMLAYSKVAKNPFWQNKAYKELAKIERNKRQYSRAVTYDSLSLTCVKQMANANEIFDAKVQLARDFMDGDMPKKAQPIIEDFAVYRSKTKDADQLNAITYTTAIFQFSINQNTKAVPLYLKAIAYYSKSKNDSMTAEAKLYLARSFITLGGNPKIIDLIFDALNYYKKKNLHRRSAYCYGLLGQSYIVNSNVDKGIENYLQAKEYYRRADSKVDEALTTSDLAAFFLEKKNLRKAEVYLKEADSILIKANYAFGMAMCNTRWGQLYSAKDNYDSAEYYFDKADKITKQANLPEVQANNQMFWAEMKYKQKEYKTADTLMRTYVKNIADQREPAMIENDVKTFGAKNKNVDSQQIKLMQSIYTKEGLETLEKKYPDKTLAEILSSDSLLMENPYSLGSTFYDSTLSVDYNSQLLNIETQYKTKIIVDSLHLEQQNTLLATQQIKNRNITLTAIIAISLLLLAGLVLQYRNRQRAEKDKEKIQLLQNEIHHRVKNNLGVISRLVDIAGKNAVDDVPLSSLKTRIKSIELLHKHLYDDKAKPGNISLQPYLEDLCLAIATTFETGQDIKINVHANEEMESQTAEKLGLIINELVTNSYKYAFRGKEQGSIQITAKRSDDKSIQIAVQDDGVGFDTGNNKNNYGMKLIKGLSHELKGKFAFSNNGGTKFQLQIPG